MLLSPERARNGAMPPTLRPAYWRGVMSQIAYIVARHPCLRYTPSSLQEHSCDPFLFFVHFARSVSRGSYGTVSALPLISSPMQHVKQPQHPHLFHRLGLELRASPASSGHSRPYTASACHTGPPSLPHPRPPPSSSPSHSPTLPASAPPPRSS